MAGSLVLLFQSELGYTNSAADNQVCRTKLLSFKPLLISHLISLPTLYIFPNRSVLHMGWCLLCHSLARWLPSGYLPRALSSNHGLLLDLPIGTSAIGSRGDSRQNWSICHICRYLPHQSRHRWHQTQCKSSTSLHVASLKRLLKSKENDGHLPTYEPDYLSIYYLPTCLPINTHRSVPTGPSNSTPGFLAIRKSWTPSSIGSTGPSTWVPSYPTPASPPSVNLASSHSVR